MARIINTRIANLLMYCWNSLLPYFLAITESVCIVGHKIGIKEGVFILSILGFGIPGNVPFGKILCFIRQMIDMGTRGAPFTILGLGIPGFVEICQDVQLATPGLWVNIRTLMYVGASALVIFTQIYLVLGATCIYAMMEFLIDKCHDLPPVYIFVLCGCLAIIAGIMKINAQIANPLMYCWNSLLLLFLGIIEILRFVGQKIGYETGVVMFTILGAYFRILVSVRAYAPMIGHFICGAGLALVPFNDFEDEKIRLRKKL